MKRTGSVLFVLLLLILAACGNSDPEISQEQAESIVIERHSGDIGEIEIISVNHKWGKYIVEWGNEENCESGTEHIDDQSGEVIKGEVSIC
ncbi:hypothetical protein CIL05_10095 [Virgibacillus profundi]|uniref:PepSY domain-containing protein n=1 Tax=Virgibacillus profundi TaxID=2024555 RepID=A0A2A2IF51_9BACI|nr:hypothetical protein [Virgibacillus profundi]PAV29713.1 hypothetical protein CIL05_10095 [Virgibacillus profundi]PXY53885.1 hypothetical protein CIT14_10195 [Virgibacillus profundi]